MERGDINIISSHRNLGHKNIYSDLWSVLSYTSASLMEIHTLVQDITQFYRKLNICLSPPMDLFILFCFTRQSGKENIKIKEVTKYLFSHQQFSCDKIQKYSFIH